MSETGATAEQLHEAIQRKLEAWGVPAEQRNDEWSDYWLASDQVNNVAPVLVPPGYQIVPAGSVVLSAEDAELGADGLSRLIARYESLANEHDRAGRTEQWLWEQNNAAKYSALAAKLSGGAS